LLPEERGRNDWSGFGQRWLQSIVDASIRCGIIRLGASDGAPVHEEGRESKRR
jgi:hypothetical protein